jgi:hypothetical protein
VVLHTASGIHLDVSIAWDSEATRLGSSPLINPYAADSKKKEQTQASEAAAQHTWLYHMACGQQLLEGG